MNTVNELIEDIRSGKMVLLVDDEDRENEGDLVLAGQFANPDHINFMISEARGLVCLALDQSQTERLGLRLMVSDIQNQSPNQTAFTVSIEAREGISTGISAYDRAHTIRVASDPNSTSSSIISPGHIFPIKARPGGVLQRTGHTEGSVDLMKLAGLNPAAVICEVMKEDGTMARLPDLKKFAEENNIKIGTIESIIEYRLQTESHIELIKDQEHFVEGVGSMRLCYFMDEINSIVHYAFIGEDYSGDGPRPVRVHVDRGPEDLFSSPNVKKLKNFLSFAKEEGGVLLVLRNSNFFSSKFQGRDFREFGIGAQILKCLGVKKISLVTNSNRSLSGLSAYGVEICHSISFSNFEDSFDVDEGRTLLNSDLSLGES